MPVGETTSKTRSCSRCGKPAAVASAVVCPWKTRTRWSAQIVRVQVEGAQAVGLHVADPEHLHRSKVGQTSMI